MRKKVLVGLGVIGGIVVCACTMVAGLMTIAWMKGGIFFEDEE